MAKTYYQKQVAIVLDGGGRVGAAPSTPPRTTGTATISGGGAAVSPTAGQRPGPGAALRLAARAARPQTDADGVGHPRQGLAAGRPPGRRHRRWPGAHLHDRLLPRPRPRRGARPGRVRGAAVLDRHLARAQPVRPRPQPGGRHRHHRVGRRDRRLLHRLLRATQGRDPRRKTSGQSVDRSFARAWRTIWAADLVSFIAAVLLWLLTVGTVRGFAFFLGLSTLLDLITAYFFTRPMVILLGRNRVLHRGALLRRQPAAWPPHPRGVRHERNTEHEAIAGAGGCTTARRVRLRRPAAPVVHDLGRRDPDRSHRPRPSAASTSASTSRAAPSGRCRPTVSRSPRPRSAVVQCRLSRRRHGPDDQSGASGTDIRVEAEATVDGRPGRR